MTSSPAADASPQTGKADDHRHRPPAKVIAGVVIGLVIGIGAYVFFSQGREDDGSKLLVSGRIEGYETNIGPKIGGRIDFMAAREGEAVKRGQLLVEVSDDDVQAQLKGAQAKITKAEEAKRQSQDQIEVVRSQIEQARFDLQQSKEDAGARIEQADSNVAAAQAKLAESEAQVVQAKSELELANVRKQRYEFLVGRGAVTTDENDQARTTANTAQAIVNAREAARTAARKDLLRAEAALSQARSTRLNPHMKNAAIVTLDKQEHQAQFQLKEAQAEIVHARAEAEEIQSHIDYLNIRSPIDGIVTARSVEPGAVVVPGQTLLSLIDLDTVYLRGYVPEGRIGKVFVGQSAKVYLDAFPKKPFVGKVIQVDPEGTFTPENIYFKDDRVKQVFGIKIALEHPDRLAKPGMPADAELNLDEARPVQKEPGKAR